MSKHNKLIVMVSGTAGSGKTTLAGLIESYLKTLNFPEVNNIDEDQKTDVEIYDMFQQFRDDGKLDNTEVEIRTQQLRRKNANS